MQKPKFVSMKKSTSQNINIFRDFSDIFSRSVVHAVLQGDFEDVNIKLKRYKSRLPQSASQTYAKLYKYAYLLLEKHYQNEYVFKNAFLTHWLIKEIGQTDSVVFNEFNAGQSIADLAMFNGTSRAFEIKTDLDSPSRLQKQIEDYKKAFNEVYLIIHESNYHIYRKYKNEVGLIIFNPNMQNRFEFVKKPIQNYKLDHSVLMQMLHTQEYKTIVKDYYHDLPQMNSFNQYKVCLNLIKQIPIEEFNTLFLEQIKTRKVEKTFSSHRYKELNQICLALKLNKYQKHNLISNLKQPVKF